MNFDAQKNCNFDLARTAKISKYPETVCEKNINVYS